MVEQDASELTMNSCRLGKVSDLNYIYHKFSQKFVICVFVEVQTIIRDRRISMLYHPIRFSGLV